MMDKKTETLKKRLQGDAACTWAIAGVIILKGFIKIFTAISGFMNGGTMKGSYDESPAILLGDGIREILIAIAVALLAMVLTEIMKTGRPFTKSTVKKFRIMASVIICCAVVKMLVSCVAGFFDPQATFQLSIELLDLWYGVVGTMIGIISEIFHYGYELQEDMDAIA